MKPTLILFLIMLLIIQGCRDLEELDISDKFVNVVAPEDSICLSSSSIYFKWDEMEGARNYQIQVVRPEFSNIEQFLYDTLVSESDITLSFLPGNYQWRIRAQNNSYMTSYTTRSFIIDSTNSVINDNVVLLLPLNNAYISNQILNFSWSVLSSGSFYRMTVKRDNWDNGTLILDSLFAINSANIGDFSEGYYLWGIRSESTNEISSYSIRSFLIDLTNPQVPVLISPLDDDQFTEPPVLQWQFDQDQGSPILDSVFVFNNSSLNEAIEVGVSNNGNYQINQLEPGTYFWRVRRYDAAGNSSSFSVVRMFQIQ